MISLIVTCMVLEAFSDLEESLLLSSVCSEIE